MSGKIKILIILIFSFFLMLSCVDLKQPHPSIKRYVLEYEVPEFSGYEPLDGVIKIDTFSAAPAYNTRRIVYSSGNYERESYIYHKWDENPGEIVTHLLGRDIRQSGLFRGVILPGERVRGFSYRLGGTLEEFYESDEENKWAGVLSLTVTLVSEKDGESGDRVIFQKNYRTSEPCERKNPAALAKALSDGLKKISSVLVSDMYKAAKQN